MDATNCKICSDDINDFGCTSCHWGHYKVDNLNCQSNQFKEQKIKSFSLS